MLVVYFPQSIARNVINQTQDLAIGIERFERINDIRPCITRPLFRGIAIVMFLPLVTLEDVL